MMLMQYNVKKGLRLFSKAGMSAVVTEMQQLHNQGVIILKHANMLMQEEKQWSLQYLMFLKQKHFVVESRDMDVPMVRNSRYTRPRKKLVHQPCHWSLCSCHVSSMQKKAKVATCDIPRAFMQSDINEVIHVKLEGPLATLLTRVDSTKYCKFLTTKNGKKASMYGRLVKALYGTLLAAYLFWKDLSRYLIQQGFELNLYDN